MIVAGMVALGTIMIGTKADASEVKVAAGDTVSTLAKKHKVSVDEIVKWNKLNDKNFIVVGDKLNIDGKDVKSKKLKSNQRQTKPVQQTIHNVQQASVQQTQSVPTQQSVTPEPVKEQPVQPQTQNNSAKDSIIHDESRGQANVTNGRYYGLYQMDVSRLNGDYSITNQERVAQKYMEERYGSWEKAEQFHQANGYW